MIKPNNTRAIALIRAASNIKFLSFVSLGAILTMAAWMLIVQPAFSQEAVKGGALNGKAIQLPVPVYPAIAKQARVVGTVTVDVVVGESGKVESAKASAGPKMLYQAAVDAAQRAKFAPTMKGGAPVKVEGTLSYTFKLD